MHRHSNRAEMISRRTLVSIRHWWCAANPNQSLNSLYAVRLCSFRKHWQVLRWPIQICDDFRVMYAIFGYPGRIWWPERATLKLNIPLVLYNLALMHKSLDWLECLRVISWCWKITSIWVSWLFLGGTHLHRNEGTFSLRSILFFSSDLN